MIHRWHFMINQFLVTTLFSFKKALKLSREHDNRLKTRMDQNPGDPDYPIAYNRYHILHQALETAYSNWKGSGGIQKGVTLTFDQLISLLPGRINKIDVKIQAIHEKGSERWTQLFPNAHSPFYRGSQDSRMVAVQTLSTVIGSELPMATIKTEVDTIYSGLQTAKALQTGSKDTKHYSSNDMEKARVNAMTCQYQNVGFFINKFPEDAASIESLFDVATLTNPEQTMWCGHLDPNENHPTLIHTFESGDMMRLKANGDGQIRTFLASTPGGTDSTGIDVLPHQELIFDVADFQVTDYSKNRYLTIVNKSIDKETRFLVELY